MFSTSLSPISQLSRSGSQLSRFADISSSPSRLALGTPAHATPSWGGAIEVASGQITPIIAPREPESKQVVSTTKSRTFEYVPDVPDAPAEYRARTALRAAEVEDLGEFFAVRRMILDAQEDFQPELLAMLGRRIPSLLAKDQRAAAAAFVGAAKSVEPHCRTSAEKAEIAGLRKAAANDSNLLEPLKSLSECIAATAAAADVYRGELISTVAERYRISAQILEASVISGQVGAKVRNGESVVAVAERFGIGLHGIRLLEREAANGPAIEAEILAGCMLCEIAKAHGITTPEGQSLLAFRAENGPGIDKEVIDFLRPAMSLRNNDAATAAAEKVFDGESISTVAQRHGISAKILEAIVIKDQAAAKVRNGESVTTVAGQYGIQTALGISSLEYEAVNGSAIRAKLLELSKVKLTQRIAIALTAIAQAHGITTEKGLAFLNFRAENGPGIDKEVLDQVRGGDPIDVIVNRYDICTPWHVMHLEHAAVDGPAGNEVRKGKSVQFIARQYGIARLSSIFRLEKIAIEADAGEKVRAGGNVQLIAKKHGIATTDAMEILESIALDGARREVKDGGPVRAVARNRGITSLSAMEELDSLAISPAIDEMRRGRTVGAAVAKQEITTPSCIARLKEESFYEVALPAVKNGSPPLDMVRQCGINDPKLQSELELIAVAGEAGAEAYRGSFDAKSIARMYGITTPSNIDLLKAWEARGRQDRATSKDSQATVKYSWLKKRLFAFGQVCAARQPRQSEEVSASFAPCGRPKVGDILPPMQLEQRRAGWRH